MKRATHFLFFHLDTPTRSTPDNTPLPSRRQHPFFRDGDIYSTRKCTGLQQTARKTALAREGNDGRKGGYFHQHTSHENTHTSQEFGAEEREAGMDACMHTVQGKDRRKRGGTPT